MQKSPTIDFWLGYKYSSWQYCQKSSHLKEISLVLSKTFCVFILIMHSLFCCETQKNVLQKELKETFKAYLLTEETSSWFLLILCQILCVVLEFLSNGEALDCFLQHNLPKLSEIIVTCPKKTNRVNFVLLKISKININVELLQVSKITSLKIYISSVTKKLGTSNFDSR